jgi:hypothetical protein
MLRIFIGYDEREATAYHVLSHSILRRAGRPICITPLSLQTLAGIFRRERDPLQSTDFAFTRFLVPYLCEYRGWGLFMDCDMLVRCDISEIFDLQDFRHAVQVVKHDHRPKERVKFLGQAQSSYECKNWSSVMLFNNVQCHRLTLDYVSSEPGLDLHQFKWLSPYQKVGELPHEYNHLVGYDAYDPAAKIIHYTLGGPWFNDCINCEYSDDWIRERAELLKCSQPVLKS